MAAMPPLDELARQIELQLLEEATAAPPHCASELNAEIAAAIGSSADGQPAAADAAAEESGGELGDELSKEFARQASGGKPKAARLSLASRLLAAETASQQGAAFLFTWGGLFARYTPPMRNFLSTDLVGRKVKHLC